MRDSAGDNGREETRDEVLGITSAIRLSLFRLGGDVEDTDSFDVVTGAGESFQGVAARSGLSLLTHCGGALQRMATIGLMLTPSETTRDLIEAMHDAVSIVEQAIDPCLDGVAGHRLDGYYAALRASVPSEWRDTLDLDEAAFAQALANAATAHTRSGTLDTEAVGAAEHDADLAFQHELLEAFRAESAERFEDWDALLLQLEKDPSNRELIDALFRQLHTLKGAAAAVDLSAAAAQLHEGESLLQSVRDGETSVEGGALVEFLLRLTDSVKGLIERARGHPGSSYVIIEDLTAEIARLHGGDRTAPPPRSIAPAAAATAPAAEQTSGVEGGASSALLAQQIAALAELRSKLGTGEISEHVRQVIEALDQQARQLSQMATDLQQEVTSLRTVPFDTVLRRLQRPVRDAARQEGKEVEIEVGGGHLRIDREVAERLFGPLLHLVRNAVAHGIEPPTVRVARGKSRSGTVRVRAEQHPGSLRISVEDDGAGLDFDAIRAKALARQWITPSGAPSRAELARLIFRPGLSTRDSVSDLAGRGVGMDAVAREIEALNGSVDIESLAGRGTNIYLTLSDGVPVDGGAAR